MMISWATGYATAFQQKIARGDAAAFVLIAGALGDACQKHQTQTAMQAIVDAVNQFTTSNGLNSASNSTVISAPSPAVALRGTFNTYDNFDMVGAELRKLQRVPFDKCTAACVGDSRCQGYSYDKWNKWCFLKSAAGELTLDPGSVSGVRKHIANPPASSVAIRTNRSTRAFSGHVQSNTHGVTLVLCESSCLNEQKCLGFTFDKQAGNCRQFDI
jgi:hypothetical protein